MARECQGMARIGNTDGHTPLPEERFVVTREIVDSCYIFRMIGVN